MVDARYRNRLANLKETRGSDARDLRVGAWVVRIVGLDRPLGQALDERWGPFVGPIEGDPATLELRVVDAGRDSWLPGPDGPQERYRMEAYGKADGRVIVSYNFALGWETAAGGAWSVAISRDVQEPTGRLLENVVRYLLAVLALDNGGFAMHCAGVLHEGRAYLYAGPSRSGKSTAVSSSVPARSLGDDFGLVIPEGRGWWAPGLPFDGSERTPEDAPRGLYPVAAIWRLYQAPETGLDRPPAPLASASLLSCVAFPWAYPERAGEILEHVGRFIDESCFGHLRFAKDSNLYAEVLERQ
jgi:hypothetical protein